MFAALTFLSSSKFPFSDSSLLLAPPKTFSQTEKNDSSKKTEMRKREEKENNKPAHAFPYFLGGRREMKEGKREKREKVR